MLFQTRRLYHYRVATWRQIWQGIDAGIGGRGRLGKSSVQVSSGNAGAGDCSSIGVTHRALYAAIGSLSVKRSYRHPENQQTSTNETFHGLSPYVRTTRGSGTRNSKKPDLRTGCPKQTVLQNPGPSALMVLH